MKKQIKLILGLFMLAVIAGRGMCGSIENFTKTIHYIPPKPFFINDVPTNEVFTDPFSIGENGVQYTSASDDQCSLLTFQLDLACYYLGDGKVYKFLPAKPSDLQIDFDKFYQDQLKLTNMPAATFRKVSGLTAVNSTATKSPGAGPTFFYFCWVQLETNIVVKISVASCDLKTFNGLTNSLQSLKINKNEILKRVASQKQLVFPY